MSATKNVTKNVTKILKMGFKKIHPSYIFMAFVVAIIVGDIWALISREIYFETPIWLIFAGLALILAIFYSRIIAVPLALLAGFICVNYRAAVDLIGQDYFQNLQGQTITITGKITEDPDTTEQKTNFRINHLKIGEQEVAGTLFIQSAKNTTIKRSDIITLKGKLTAGFGTFPGMMYRPQIMDLVREEPGDIFLTMRDFFADKVRLHLSDGQAALGLGYLLGARSSLPDGLADTLKIVGLTHIIVASGANLSILIGFARKFLGKISRFTGLIGSALLVFSYVGIVGLQPSMTRAGLVSVLSLVAWYVGRNFQPWRLLTIVAAATLLYNPMYLIDLGWLLSFASFAGIMILGPEVTKFFYGEKEPNFLGATLLETVSASLLCTPILLYFFGTLSLISLLANLLILPTISAAMALTFLTGVLAMVAPPLAGVVGWVTGKLLDYHLWVINFFGAQDLFLLKIPAEDPRVFLLYIPLLLLMGGKKLYNLYKCKRLKMSKK